MMRMFVDRVKILTSLLLLLSLFILNESLGEGGRRWENGGRVTFERKKKFPEKCRVMLMSRVNVSVGRVPRMVMEKNVR